MRIEFRIKPELKQAFASYCEANGQTITETLIKYIEDCTHNKKDIVRTDIESVHTKKNIVATKKQDPKIENKTQNKIDVGNMSLAQIMQLKRNNKA